MRNIFYTHNQLNNGSKTFREKNGLDTDGYCDEKMIADWKLELMAKEVLGACWQNRKEDAMEAFRLIKQYAVADKKIGNTELSSINSDIDKLNNRLEKMIEMRADGELTKEEYAKSKAKIESELDDLNKRKAGLDNSDDSSEFHLDLRTAFKGFS